MQDTVFIIIISGALLIFWFSFLIIDNKSNQSNSHGHLGLEKFEKALQSEYASILKEFHSQKLEREIIKDHHSVESERVISTKKSQLQKIESAPDDEPCRSSFPPSCPMDSSVVYWKTKPDCYESPARIKEKKNRKYVVFEPDLGGWNNIRMGVEVVIVFAHATGRTLVIPPKAVLYLLSKNKRWHDNKSGLEDFYNMTVIGHHGFDVISMEEFLETVAKPGHLAAPLPNNDTSLSKRPLWEYLQKSCYTRRWTPSKYFVGFNITQDDAGKPLIGHIKPSRRLTDITLERQMIPFDKEMNDAKAIFFSGQEPNRLLTHFYAYLYFADPGVDRFYKRFVRDRLRYHESIFCTSSKIIRLLRQEAALPAPTKGSPLPPMGKITELSKDMPDLGSAEGKRYPPYFAFHIRRGDFQQKQTRLPAETLVENILPFVDLSVTHVLYISTDEGNRSFFDPFRAVFPTVRFLYDYSDLPQIGMDDINQNHVGMIEQVICANAHTFIGTPLSTFTAFITRMRGYNNRTDGRYPNTFYTMPGYAKQFHTAPRLNRPIWIREFTDAFEDIDEPV